MNNEISLGQAAVVVVVVVQNKRRKRWETEQCQQRGDCSLGHD